MTIERWIPCQTYSHQEEAILKSLRRTRKLFAFLRDHRHELFDDEMQSTLESMYRNTGAGKDPVCPARMAVAALMQGYLAVSDAEAVQLTMVDLRWQMVLGCLGSTEEAFSQGAFQEFRQRLIRHDIDRVLLEKTIALARTTKAFDYRQLPKGPRMNNSTESSSFVDGERPESSQVTHSRALSFALRFRACWEAPEVHGREVHYVVRERIRDLIRGNQERADP